MINSYDNELLKKRLGGRNLYLIGMMGSGKTTIGKSLSQRLEMGFADIDAIIEKKVGLSISEIFEKKGEKAFRQEEEEESKKMVVLYI